ncbi:MAG: peptide ABC transporter substrate-binding protein, partial [Mesorhizobium sp.]
MPMSDNQKDSLAQLATHTLDRRAFMIRASALGLGGIAANSLFAKHARAATPKKGGALKIGLTGGGATDTLDPALAGSQVPFHLCHMFGEPLVEVSPQGHGIEPRLATEYSSNPDATVWTFKIRKGVKFHDGSTLQPDDVAATLKRHIDKNSKSVAYGILRGITNVEAKGDDVVITVASPTADFPYLMTSYNLVIQPKGGVGAPAAGIGTSAYKLVRAEAGVGYQFAKFDDYWDDSRGHFDT